MSIFLQITIYNVGDVFDVFPFISTHISLVLFPEVMQKQTFYEVKY